MANPFYSELSGAERNVVCLHLTMALSINTYPIPQLFESLTDRYVTPLYGKSRVSGCLQRHQIFSGRNLEFIQSIVWWNEPSTLHWLVFSALVPRHCQHACHSSALECHTDKKNYSYFPCLSIYQMTLRLRAIITPPSSHSGSERKHTNENTIHIFLKRTFTPLPYTTPNYLLSGTESTNRNKPVSLFDVVC